jgi:hypothetical protein
MSADMPPKIRYFIDGIEHPPVTPKEMVQIAEMALEEEMNGIFKRYEFDTMPLMKWEMRHEVE